MASSPPDHNPLDLEVTVISAKHLKNINWRKGPLKPYVSFYLDPNPSPSPNPNPPLIQRLSTRVDDSGSSRPVWNELFFLPISRTFLRDSSFLTFEIYHSKPSETPKPLVGTARFSLHNLDPDSPEFTHLDLLRPSGRPQGKLRVKFVLRERAYSLPHYYSFAPGELCNYHPAPPTPAPSSYGYSGYGYGYYAPTPLPPSPPPPPARHFFNRPPNYVPPQTGPSAPIDFSPSDNNAEAKPTVPSATPPPPPNVSIYNSMYGPSAPVDYTYPSYDHKPTPPPPRWIHNPSPPVDSDRSCAYNHLKTVIPPPQRWISSHDTSPPVGYVPSYDHRTSSGPTAPDDLASKQEEETAERNGSGVRETVGSVTSGVGGMSLKSYPRREGEIYGGYDDYRHGY